MKLEIDTGLANRLDEEAEALVKLLATEPLELHDTTGIFRFSRKRIGGIRVQ